MSSHRHFPVHRAHQLCCTMSTPSRVLQGSKVKGVLSCFSTVATAQHNDLPRGGHYVCVQGPCTTRLLRHRPRVEGPCTTRLLRHRPRIQGPCTTRLLQHRPRVQGLCTTRLLRHRSPRSGTVYYTPATAQAPSKVWGPKRVRQEGLSAHGVLSLVQVLKL